MLNSVFLGFTNQNTMNFKLILTILLSTLFALPINAQRTIGQHAACGTVTSQEQMDWLRHYRKNIAPTYKMSGDILYVPIVFHIVGQDDGAGYYPAREALRILCEFNENYSNNESGIQFFLKENGGIRYHNNSRFFTHDLSDNDAYETIFCNQKKVDNVVNLFIVSNVSGVCGYYSPSSDCVVLIKDCIGPGSTTATHELGHFFTLPHPFFGWEGYDFPDDGPSNFIRENAARTGPDQNCYDKADLFCDTGADYESDRWNCSNPPEFVDPKGVEFEPDGTLFMSYSNDECQTRFSTEQLEAMQANLTITRSSFLDDPQVLNFNDLTHAATLNYPIFGDENVPNQNVTFKWENAGDVKYLFTLNNVAGSEILFNHTEILTETEFKFESLPADVEFEWAVVAFTDDRYCTAPSSINKFKTVEALPFVLSTIDINSPTCFGDTNGAVNLAVEGGTAPYTFNWDDGYEGSSRTDVSGGTYIITVADADNNEQEISIFVDTPFELIYIVQQDGDEVEVTVELPLDIDNLRFEWSNGGDEATITGAVPGEQYQVNIFDLNGCSSSLSFNALDVDGTVTDAACFGGSNGKIELGEPMGGQGPYFIDWFYGGTGPVLDSLPANDYRVSIYEGDVDNFRAFFFFTVGEAEEIVTEVSVNGLNAEASTVGGVEPYTYNWDSSFVAETATNLSAGGHILYVEDANGCITENSFFVFPLSKPDVTTEPAACGSANGYASIEQPTWGGEPYTYTWPDGEEAQERSDLLAGVYDVVITDGVEGWDQTIEVEITQSVGDIEVEVVQSGNTVSYVATGGAEPYSVEWSNGESTDEVQDLEAGENTITLMDDSGCLIEQTFNFINLEYEVQNVDCKGENSGEIKLETAKGGKAPYDYSWNTGDDGRTFKNLEAGTYTVTVTDSEDLAVEFEFTVEEPEIELYAEVEIDKDNATAIVEGGWGDYTYEWSNGDDTETAEGLDAGEYDLEVTDAEGCSFKVDFELFLSIEELSNTNFSVYPNPINSEEKLNIELGELNTNNTVLVEIYSENGKLLKSTKEQVNQNNSLQIDVNKINAGLYFIQLTTEKQKLAKKLLIF